MVDSSGLENRYSSRNYRGFESLSLLLLIEYACFFNFLSLFCPLSFFHNKGMNGSARWNNRARTEKNKTLEQV